LAGALSLTAALWSSTWAQAALIRAALTEETTRECLCAAWGRTAAFAWVLTMVMLAVVGGFFLLIIPGLLLSVLLFAAPFRAVAGEADGARALGLSWARARPRFGTVLVRLGAASLLAAAPGYVPYAGWLIMLFWAPFGVVAIARLDKDLRAAQPEAEAPSWMGAAVVCLAVVFFVGTSAAVYGAARLTMAAARNFDPQSAQDLIKAVAGRLPAGVQ
jgi:hypothetical protein